MVVHARGYQVNTVLLRCEIELSRSRIEFRFEAVADRNAAFGEGFTRHAGDFAESFAEPVMFLFVACSAGLVLSPDHAGSVDTPKAGLTVGTEDAEVTLDIPVPKPRDYGTPSYCKLALRWRLLPLLQRGYRHAHR